MVTLEGASGEKRAADLAHEASPASVRQASGHDLQAYLPQGLATQLLVGVNSLLVARQSSVECRTTEANQHLLVSGTRDGRWIH